MSRLAMLALPLACALATSCTNASATATPQRFEPLLFGTLVRPIASVPLASDDSSFIGVPIATVMSPTRLIVVDRKRAEIRLFSRFDGTRIAVTGGPGDGFGQLRRPAAAASLDSGQFAVLDDGRRLLSIRDSLGRVLRELRLPEGSYSSVMPLLAQRRLVVAGRVFYGADSIRQCDLHEFDYEGRHLASYGEKAPASTLWARAFATVVAAGAGGELATATLGSNRVRVLRRQSRTERWASVASGWYAPLEFPSDRLLQHGTTQQTATARVSAWTHQHRLLNGLFFLAGDRMLVRFQAFDPAGQRFYYYALTDRAGTRFVMSRPTRVNVLSARGDTLSWIGGGGDRPAAFVTGVVAGAEFIARRATDSAR